MNCETIKTAHEFMNCGEYPFKYIVAAILILGFVMVLLIFRYAEHLVGPTDRGKL